MSQNDPLLGNDWLEKEEPIGGQSIQTLNGIPFGSVNGKTDTINSKTNLNYTTIDTNTVGNNRLNHNSNHFQTNRLKDNSKQQLMSAIAMSSSDSSSDDIVIPMQRRKIKTRFPRKRRSRSTDSNLSIKTRALNSCPSICLKVVLILMIVSSIGFTVVFIAKLYDRIDSLQTAINDLSVSGNSVPQEMHSIHSHLKTLDTNVTSISTQLVLAFDRIDNLTQEVKQIKILLTKISDSVEAAPAIRQLPKELQDLQKVVAEMGSRLSTNDNEVKSIKDKQNTEQSKADTLVSELNAIRSNVTELYQLVNSSVGSAKVEQNSRQLTQLFENLSHLEETYTKLINWKTEADEQIHRVMDLTQHIHEKLHNQSLSIDNTNGSAEHPLTVAVKQNNNNNNVSHIKKQSEDLTVSPILNEPIESTLASNQTLV